MNCQGLWRLSIYDFSFLCIMSRLLFIGALFCLFGCVSSPKIQSQDLIVNDGYSIPVYDFNNFELLLKRSNDTLYIYNFWATWCRPCVEELPDFEYFNSQNRDKSVKIILVSIDMKRTWKNGLTSFLFKNNIQNDVVVLDDVDANSWISKVNASWDGAIPATLFVFGDKKVFHHGKLTKEELHQLVDDIRK